jgi:hypothetical protein
MWKKFRGNISGSEKYRLELRQHVTISRDLNPPYLYNDVMARNGCIFRRFSKYICNINTRTNATITLGSKTDESEKNALTLELTHREMPAPPGSGQ